MIGQRTYFRGEQPLNVAVLVLVAALDLTNGWHSPAAEPHLPSRQVGKLATQQRSQQLATAVLTPYARLHSLSVLVRSHWLMPDADIQWLELIAKDRCRWERSWHGTWGSDPDDPRPALRFFDGTYFNSFKVRDRIYETSKRFTTAGHLEKIKDIFFYETLGWWPPNDPDPRPRVNGISEFYCDILRDPQLRLAERGGQCDGQECSIVETPCSRLWIDARIGVVRRRQIMEPRPSGDSQVAVDISLSDFKQFDKGIWLPTVIVRTFPSGNLPRAHHSIEYRAVNSVPPDSFAFSPPPGTFVYDRDTDTNHQIPGGIDLRELVVARVESITRAARPRPSKGGPLTVIGLTLGGFFVGVLGRWVVDKKGGPQSPVVPSVGNVT
jgi:hypothetical protein